MNIVYVLSGGGSLQVPLCSRRDQLDSVHRGSGSRCGGKRRCWLGAASGYFAPTNFKIKIYNFTARVCFVFQIQENHDGQKNNSTMDKEEIKNQENYKLKIIKRQNNSQKLEKRKYKNNGTIITTYFVDQTTDQKQSSLQKKEDSRRQKITKNTNTIKTNFADQTIEKTLYKRIIPLLFAIKLRMC